LDDGLNGRGSPYAPGLSCPLMTQRSPWIRFVSGGAVLRQRRAGRAAEQGDERAALHGLTPKAKDGEQVCAPG
jgi:hypothetical protein